jgi:hypothetical protein
VRNRIENVLANLLTDRLAALRPAAGAALARVLFLISHMNFLSRRFAP